MREIVLDTETTGLDPDSGHRVVEIGCVELVNHMPTGEIYHVYLNPERDMPMEAERVHGLSEEFLSDKPVFETVADGFAEFIGDAVIVAHNAGFDMKFINAEMKRVHRAEFPKHQSLDTVDMARRKYPGAQNSLDALCRRFGIDNSHRTKHGALLDAELLAEVYLELIGGREPGLELSANAVQRSQARQAEAPKQVRPPRAHEVPEPEKAAHKEFLEKLTDPIWKQAS